MHARGGLRAAVAGLLGVGFALGLLASPAAAEPPTAISTELVDTAGVLGSQTGAVKQAQADLTSATNLRLYVVFVNSFDGADPQSWATETATSTGLSTTDILLAVAVTDRKYALIASNRSPVSASDQNRVRTDVLQPQLKKASWAAAAIDTAKALQSASSGSNGSTTGSSSSAGTSSLLTWFLVGLVVIGGFLLFRSVRNRARAPQPQTGPGQPAPVDTKTLNRQASGALVTLDDELRASEQELGFAQAQFGEVATRTFTTVLAAGKSDALEAFRLRQLLDDDQPETEDQRRAMLTQILALCTRADASLHEQTESFDALRDLQARAPALLEETDGRATALGARIEPATRTLAGLAATYPATSLASVSTNPGHATQLLAAAHASVEVGRAALTDDDRAGAVEAGRTAEHAVAQAASLLDAVDRAGDELVGATAAIAAGIASISSDLDDAARLAPGDPAVRAAAAAATTARAAARAAGPGSDPLALTRDLRDVEAALDKALEPARGAAERADRTRAQLTAALGPLRSRVRGVADYIENRRGAVGPEARTRLAEAQRILEEAESLVTTDPARGLEAVQRADELAANAQWQAQADVEEYDQKRRGGPGGQGGGSNAGSLLLGGILLGDLLGGGRGGGGFGGGWGGGGGGGGGFGGGGGGFGGGGGSF